VRVSAQSISFGTGSYDLYCQTAEHKEGLVETKKSFFRTFSIFFVFALTVLPGCSNPTRKALILYLDITEQNNLPSINGDRMVVLNEYAGIMNTNEALDIQLLYNTVSDRVLPGLNAVVERLGDLGGNINDDELKILNTKYTNSVNAYIDGLTILKTFIEDKDNEKIALYEAKMKEGDALYNSWFSEFQAFCKNNRIQFSLNDSGGWSYSY
jgi:hypothetical protein